MKRAMILAAGRGERLRPLTDITPKALCRVNNIPLIEYHVEKLAQAGFERLVINHAWLGGQIRQHLGDGARWGVEICYSPEPPGGLETGGAIANALPLLGRMPFLTVNADIFTDYNFANFTSPADSLAHVILINKPTYLAHADFGLTSTGLLSNQEKLYTFAGIACYQPELFYQKTPGRYSVTPLLRELAAQGRATGIVYHGRWIDIGSQERLSLAKFGI